MKKALTGWSAPFDCVSLGGFVQFVFDVLFVDADA